MPSGASAGTKPYVAFGILPLKPEPQGAHFSCYLLNDALLHAENIWTTAAWNASPDLKPAVAPATSLLIATEDGRLLLANLKTLPEVNVKENAAAWHLLRSGSVVGMVPLGGDETLIPIINLAAFATPSTLSLPPAFAGTLDFKWPRGSVIRIRIDEPNENGTTATNWAGAALQLDPSSKAVAVQTVKRLAQLWLTSAEIPEGNLRVAFVESTEDDYDVLINLDPLAKRQSVPAGGEAVLAPESALGTYAQRSPLGTPTSYCGHPEGLKDEDGNEITPGDYYSSKAFTHIVLHELGHVFGLPHLHQHPAAPGSIVQAAIKPQLEAIILDKLGLSVEPGRLAADLLKWPGDAKEFADWPDLGGQAPGKFAGESIMMGHAVRGILEGDDGDPRLEYRSEPGSKDIEWLRLLYA